MSAEETLQAAQAGVRATVQKCDAWVAAKPAKGDKPERPAHPCGKDAAFPDGRCPYHSSDPVAKAAQLARLGGSGAKKKPAAKRRPKDPAAALAQRVGELEALAERAARRGDLGTAARLHEQVTALQLPMLRAQAEAAAQVAAAQPAAPAGPIQVRVSQALATLSDEELAAVKHGVALMRVGAERFAMRDQQTTVASVPAPVDEHLTITTRNNKEPRE